MKKLSIFLASLAVLVGFSSCEDKKEPTYQNPTSFELNTPELQDQYYQLTEGNTFEIVCKSQPNYGYSAVTYYSAEVSLTDDFAECSTLKNGNSTSSRMTFNDADLALAICSLMGLTSDDEGYVFTSPVKVYFRGKAYLDGVEGSEITSSNVVSLNQVMPYFAVPSPGYIWLVGQPEGWAGPSAANIKHYEPWRLFEDDDAIGSAVYHGTFTIDAGTAMFRFYTSMTDWDTDSYGTQEEDNPIEFDFDGNTFNNPLVKGKGSFSFPNWAGGQMQQTVDMANMEVTFVAL
ncbi:MAG: SusE domain-containing protein [Bacteroidales bacterium]|nr:SusE domain-containing protein [Bacteroidales bacterium]